MIWKYSEISYIKKKKKATQILPSSQAQFLNIYL